MQNRLRSWALWTSLSALILFCIKQFTGADLAEPVNAFMDLLLPVLAAFGIINNPTDPDSL